VYFSPHWTLAPGRERLAALSVIVRYALERRLALVIGGDFNSVVAELHLEDGGSSLGSSRAVDGLGRLEAAWAADNALRPLLIDRPTCRTTRAGKTVASPIDHIYVNSLFFERYESEVRVQFVRGLSDHSFITLMCRPRRGGGSGDGVPLPRVEASPSQANLDGWLASAHDVVFVPEEEDVVAVAVAVAAVGGEARAADDDEVVVVVPDDAVAADPVVRSRPRFFHRSAPPSYSSSDYIELLQQRLPSALADVYRLHADALSAETLLTVLSSVLSRAAADAGLLLPCGELSWRTWRVRQLRRAIRVAEALLRAVQHYDPLLAARAILSLCTVLEMCRTEAAELLVSVPPAPRRVHVRTPDEAADPAAWERRFTFAPPPHVRAPDRVPFVRQLEERLRRAGAGLRTDSVLTHVNFSPDAVAAAIRRLKRNRAAGLDGIYAEMLQSDAVLALVAAPLADAFRRILTDGALPAGWLAALTVLVAKRSVGDSDPESYRPITILVLFNKVFDLILSQSLWEHLVRTHALSRFQLGFVPGRSCTHHIATLASIIDESRRSGRRLWVATLDVKAAYDSVPRDLAIAAIAARGVGGDMLRAITLSTSSTGLRLSTGGRGPTRFVRTSAGVRQGSPLAPAIYDCFLDPMIRDLSFVTNAEDGHVLGVYCAADRSLVTAPTYADDIGLVADSDDDMRELLQLASDHSLSHRFTFNVSKCTIAVFEPLPDLDDVSRGVVVAADAVDVDPPSQPFLLCGVPIPVVKRFKYLGVDFDASGEDVFSSHRSRMLAKCRRVSLDICRSVVLHELRTVAQALEHWRAALAAVEFGVFVYLPLSPPVERNRFLYNLSLAQSTALLAVCGLGSVELVDSLIESARLNAPDLVPRTFSSFSLVQRLQAQFGVLSPAWRLRLICAFWILDHSLCPSAPPPRHALPFAVAPSSTVVVECLEFASPLLAPHSLVEVRSLCRTDAELRPRMREVARLAAFRAQFHAALDPASVSPCRYKSAQPLIHSSALGLAHQQQLVAARIGWSRLVAAAHGRRRSPCSCRLLPLYPPAVLAHALLCRSPARQARALPPLPLAFRSPVTSADALGDIVTGGRSLLRMVGAAEFVLACRLLSEWLMLLRHPP
jgi:hypothetical protein